MNVDRHPRYLPDPTRARASSSATSCGRRPSVARSPCVAAVVAVVWANLDFASYEHFRELQIGPLNVEEWASDGALTIFFFVAGLELKRELLVGSLRRPADAAVPVVRRLLWGGRAGADLRGGQPAAPTTWAAGRCRQRPTSPSRWRSSSVVGSALPSQLRAFLLTLAVVDDLIVIVVIAVFYTSTIHFVRLLVLVRRLPRVRRTPATTRTQLLHLPARGRDRLGGDARERRARHDRRRGPRSADAGHPRRRRGPLPAERLEHRIAPVSSAVAVPFFALLSAGVVLTGGMGLLASRIVLGVVLGLVLGKPIGVLGGSWLLTRFTRAAAQRGSAVARPGRRRRAGRRRVHGVAAGQRPRLHRAWTSSRPRQPCCWRR